MQGAAVQILSEITATRVLLPFMLWSRPNTLQFVYNECSETEPSHSRHITLPPLSQPIDLLYHRCSIHSELISHIMSERASSRPPSPPSLANIHPLGDDPTEEQKSFIQSHFDLDAERDFRRLRRQTNIELHHALKTADGSGLVATNSATHSLYVTEAERISRIGEASRTDAASSQSKTGQGPLIELDQTQDGTSAKSTGTARQ